MHRLLAVSLVLGAVAAVPLAVGAVGSCTIRTCTYTCLWIGPNYLCANYARAQASTVPDFPSINTARLVAKVHCYANTPLGNKSAECVDSKAGHGWITVRTSCYIHTIWQGPSGTVQEDTWCRCYDFDPMRSPSP